jgi:hypothetical protein
MRITSAVAAMLAALGVAVVLAGCGSTNPTEVPSTIYPESSPTGTVPALKAYLNDAKGVLTDVGATAAALPDAVKGISKTPDDTWTTAATSLQDVSTQLGSEAAALAALQPPSTLQPVQDAVVTGIEGVQSAVDKLASALESRSQSAETKKAQIQSKLDGLKSQLDGLSQQLSGALSGL